MSLTHEISIVIRALLDARTADEVAIYRQALEQLLSAQAGIEALSR